jgi:hypothetical protein
MSFKYSEKQLVAAIVIIFGGLIAASLFLSAKNPEIDAAEKAISAELERALTEYNPAYASRHKARVGKCLIRISAARNRPCALAREFRSKQITINMAETRYIQLHTSRSGKYGPEIYFTFWLPKGAPVRNRPSAYPQTANIRSEIKLRRCDDIASSPALGGKIILHFKPEMMAGLSGLLQDINKYKEFCRQER